MFSKLVIAWKVDVLNYIPQVCGPIRLQLLQANIPGTTELTNTVLFDQDRARLDIIRSKTTDVLLKHCIINNILHNYLLLTPMLFGFSSD